MRGISRVIAGLVVTAALLAMAGCGASAPGGVPVAPGVNVQQNGDSVTVTGADGSTVSSSGEGTLPEGFPADMPVYNGTIKTGMSSDEGQGKEFIVVLETADAASAVFSWYEAQLPEKGWTVKSTMKTEDGGLLSGEKGTSVFTIVTDVPGEGDNTEVSISVAPKP